MEPVYVWNCFFSSFLPNKVPFFCDHPYPFNETIRFCATKKTGLPTVIWLVAKKLNFEFQNFKNDDFFNFSFNFLVSYAFFISDLFFCWNFMSKLKISMQRFQLKNCVFTAVRWIFQISNETNFSFRPVSLKLVWNQN